MTAPMLPGMAEVADRPVTFTAAADLPAHVEPARALVVPAGWRRESIGPHEAAVLTIGSLGAMIAVDRERARAGDANPIEWWVDPPMHGASGWAECEAEAVVLARRAAVDHAVAILLAVPSDVRSEALARLSVAGGETATGEESEG